MKADWNPSISQPRPFSPEDFRRPDTRFGPVYSWVWDAPLDEDTIRSQIDEMDRAGIRAFYIIPEPPELRPTNMITTMTPDYLGPEFFEMFKIAVAHGNSKGMEVWIYDEGGWPSGSACGQVVKAHPELHAKRLDARTAELAAGAAYVPAEGTLAAFAGKQRIAAGQTFAEATTVTEYYRKKASDKLPDLTEPGTAEAFMQVTHERYWKALTELGGHYVPCLFTDEPLSAMPAFPMDFAERFQAEYGYSILDYLYVLFDQETLTSEEAAVRSDYGMLVKKLLSERFMEPVQRWCREHGFILTGHLDRDHMIDRYVAAYGNPLSLLRTMDMPGIDVILRQIYPKDNPILEGQGFFPRLAPSAAAQTGHLLSLSESFAVYGNELTCDQMRWIANYQLVRGIQVINPMLIPYGREEWLGYGERPYFCKEIPGYYHLKQWNRDIGRTSYFMSCGLPVTDCALYLPVEEIWQDPKFVQAYHDMGEALEKAGIDFDIIDREAILQGEVKDGALHIGHAAYRRIYLPEGVVPSSETAQVLSQLSGAADAPASSDCAKVKLRCRRWKDEWYIMAFCESVEPVTSAVTIRSGNACYRADPETGKLWKLCDASASGTQRITLTLMPGEACLILASGEPYAFSCEKPLRDTAAARLEACTQTAEMVCDKAGIHRDETRKPLVAGESFRELVGPAFSGEICYRFSLNLTTEQLCADRFVLVLERLEHSAGVAVNGRDAGIITMKPYRLELERGLLKAGENVLEITVANTAANRYAATDTSAWFDSAHTGPYHPQELNFEAERSDGGLYGPVTLEIF